MRDFSIAAVTMPATRCMSRTPLARLAANTPYDDGLFAVAPMMDYTNQFMRFLLRRISLRQTLYTEMVTANTIVHCKESELSRFLANDGDREQPSVLQLGGANPEMLRKASAIALPWGYTAINLNVGCPSDRVAGSGCFGAALMREPQLVADCCAAMSDGVSGQVPITVKCRIGITEDKARAAEADDERDYAALAHFVETVSSRGGVECFAVHARNAVLGGLSPAQNRQIPPLRYHLVRRLAADFPSLRFSLNGGIETMEAAVQEMHGERVDGNPGDGQISGVMVGRAVVARPWDWSTLDTQLYRSPTNPAACRRQVLDEYCDYVAAFEASVPQRVRHLLLAPALNLFHGEPHGKQFRRTVDQMATAHKDRSAAELLRGASQEVLLEATLDAPPGWRWDRNTREYMPFESVTK